MNNNNNNNNNNINPLLLNQHHQISSSLQDLIMPAAHHQIFTSDPDHDDFLEQMLSSVPSSSAAAAAAFPWGAADDLHLDQDQSSAAVLASKLRQHQISNGAAKALMLQQQLLSSTLDGAFFPNDVVDADSFNSVNTANDASIKALFNGFTANGSGGQTSSQPQHFQHHPQAQNLGEPAAAAMNQASGGGGGGAQPRQRVRARRGQATDPHSIAERLRRERIAERMKALQELVPNGNKTDKASMLDEIIDYVKFLQLQVKVLSMSRLGGAGGVAASNEGRIGKGTLQTASSSPNNNNKNEGTTTVTEQQVAKLMEEDMGSAMQYLQGKGLCLMPISLATAISTATTSHSRKPPSSLMLSPISPSISSALTVGEATFKKDSTSVSKP